MVVCPESVFDKWLWSCGSPKQTSRVLRYLSVSNVHAACGESDA